jgi:hypothetical protein
VTVIPETRAGRFFAGGYIALVAVTVAFVISTFVLSDSDGGANMSGVSLFVVTMPWSLFLITWNQPDRQMPAAVLIIGLLGAAALNAWLLGRLGERRGRAN